MRVTIMLVVVGLAVSLAAQTQFLPGPTLPQSVYGGAIGDLDNDGDQDILVRGPGLYVSPLIELRNDGHGGFTQVNHAAYFYLMLAHFLIDFDGDGDLDVLMHGRNYLWGPTVWRLLRRESGGNYVLAPQNGTFGTARAAVACDIDGDGDQDLVATDLLRGFQIMVNNAGAFTNAAGISFGGGPSVDVADIDGDGDLDILSPGSGPWLRRNDGGLVFTDLTPQLPAVGTQALGGAFGDVDGDGDQDIYFTAVGQDSVLLNDGSGNFTLAVGAAVAVAGNSQYVDLVDIDGDGDLDLLRSATEPFARNDGTGVFTLDTSVFTAAMCNVAPFGVADFDGDLDLDALCMSHVLFNQLRHLQAPNPPTVGQVWAVDVSSLPAAPGPARLVQVGVSLQQLLAPLPIPQVGSLWLDPAHFITVQTSWIAANQSVETFVFPIPNIPLLAGIGLHVQALIADGGPAGVHLTHMVSQVIQ